MDQRDLFQAMEDNEAECFSLFCVLPETRLETNAAYLKLFTGQKSFWLFNGFFKLRLGESEAEKAVAGWVRDAEQGGYPFGVFSYPQSTPRGLEKILERHGLEAQPEGTLISFDTHELGNLRAPPLAQGYQLEEVNSAERVEGFFRCFAQVFGAPPDIVGFMHRWGMAYGWGPERHYRSIRITHEGETVAIASYFLSSGIGGIYNVGVLPSHRQRGLGTQVAKVIAEKAQAAGIRYLGSGGSPEGLYVYRKAKIQEIGKNRRWSYHPRTK